MKVDVEFIATPELYELAEKKGFRVQPAMWDTWEIKDGEDFVQKAEKYNKKDIYYNVLRCCIANEDLENFNQSNSQSDNS